MASIPSMNYVLLYSSFLVSALIVHISTLSVVIFSSITCLRVSKIQPEDINPTLLEIFPNILSKESLSISSMTFGNLSLIIEISALNELGGTISGEHGIGLIQKPYMDIVIDKTRMHLMKEIKKVFDPNNILNAGKIFD